jgi:hypothetical protein
MIDQALPPTKPKLNMRVTSHSMVNLSLMTGVVAALNMMCCAIRESGRFQV